VNYVDLVLILLLVVAGFSGYRKGLITAVLSLVGAVAGALLALQIAPALASHVDEQLAKIGIGGVLVVVGIILGMAVGTWLGSLVARQLRWQPAVAVDRGLGMVGQMVAVLALAWLVALPIAALPVPSLSAQIRSSSVIASVDKVMPPQAERVSAGLRSMFTGSGFPPILAPLAPAPSVPVDAPDDSMALDPDITGQQPSILKVRTQAPQCGASMEGTGFVVAPGMVATNAHVVAGSSSVSVETASGVLPAEVVEYDSSVDLAVLKVAGLRAAPLTFAERPAKTGDDAAAVGYPLDGPFTVSPMRIRAQTALRGPDIYEKETVTREVYTLRGSVRPGNSGGPLLAPDGTVVGVIFGAAIDNPDVGFALTARQAAPVIAAGIASREEVGTGACTAH
jgi:S1-C subfamily serine protease